ncbi:MAG: serine/threonine-protein kinase [Sandaracinaceae bacterium]
MQPSPDPVELTYRPIVRLDQGGMAEVLLADALGPGGFRRRVVLKRLLPSLRRDPAQIDAFLREARLLSTIRHRNVVGVHRLDRIDGALVLVMDYVEGTTAEGLRRDGEQAPLDPFVAAYVVAEAAAGLQAAHEREDGGIVHRDVAPRNILVGVDGRVVLADFGIARAAGTAHRTADGVVKGTLAYVAPERLHGAPYDHRADVFALGVVLWELLTGQRLYDRPTPLAVAAAIGDADAPPPGSFRRGLPAAFDGIVEGALARDPAQRTPDAGALRASLLTALGSDPEPYRAADRLAARARRVADAPGADGAHADAAATLSTPSAGRAVARTEHHPDRATRWPRARTAAATGLAAAFVAVGAYALLGGAGGPAG